MLTHAISDAIHKVIDGIIFVSAISYPSNI